MQLYPKILRKIVFVPAVTRKRQVAPERLLQTQSVFWRFLVISGFLVGTSFFVRCYRLE